MNRERFVVLNIRVAIHQHGDLLRRIARKERKSGWRDRSIVGRGGRRPIDRRVIHFGILRRAAGLCDREDIGSSAAVAFIVAHIIDRECRGRIVFNNG